MKLFNVPQLKNSTIFCFLTLIYHKIMGALLEIKIDQFYVESVPVEYLKPAKLQQILNYLFILGHCKNVVLQGGKEKICLTTNSNRVLCLAGAKIHPQRVPALSRGPSEKEGSHEAASRAYPPSRLLLTNPSFNLCICCHTPLKVSWNILLPLSQY